ncbi:hypothetical protein TgHK011_001899 [Trichoderma gracile]|nr:hypothetical protein TgHK011_001899 [Trichoderma gracile]
MPHLVSSFLRSSTGSIPHIKAVSRSRNTSRSTSRSASRNTSPHASDSDDRHAVKMPDLADAIRKHHRLSLHFGRSASKERHQHVPYSPVVIDWSVESPPVVFHGNAEDSTGALVSGQLYLDIKEDLVDVESFEASLNLVVTHKRPFQNNCSDCQAQSTEVEKLKLLPHPVPLRKGKHQFPFSILLPGHLPASMDTPVVSIAYVLSAEAQFLTAPTAPEGFSTISSAKFERIIDVKRTLPEPLYPHNSVRVFPPTNIKAAASYVSVVHPTGNNKMTLKLDGLMTHNERVKTVDLWKLKKLTWKLEETIKTVAPACERHNPGLAESATKGLPRSETRVVGEQTLNQGWKSDYSGSDGIVDMEFEFCVNQLKPHSNALKYACDMKTPDGTEVTHSLLLELVVSKEYAQEGRTNVSHQTGTGRILRMHFAVVLTDNGGLSVSWDNEAPPVYQDVPPSPPEYAEDEMSPTPPIEYYDLEELVAARATAPNSRRGSQELS